MDTIGFKSGRLEIYYGPMCSGKTFKIHLRLSEFSDIGLSTCYINSIKDTRQGSNSGFSTNCYSKSPKSAISDKIRQIKVNNLFDLEKDINFDKIQVIGIDEAQLFTDLKPMVIKLLNNNKIVIVSGLNGNFKMLKYGSILDLIPLADYSEHLTAHCKVCLVKGLSSEFPQPVINKAPFTLRLTQELDETVIGGTQIYAPVCRYHYNKLMKMDSSDRYLAINSSHINHTI